MSRDSYESDICQIVIPLYLMNPVLMPSFCQDSASGFL